MNLAASSEPPVDFRAHSISETLPCLRAREPPGTALPRPGVLLDGRLRVTFALGVGASGAVFEAWDERARRHVALKFVHPEAGYVPEEMLASERRALEWLRHPALPEFYGGGTCAFGPYVEMERLDPRTLADRVAGGGMEPAHALDAIARVADALDTLHEAGFAHRDVKAENVLFRGDRAVLVDFALSLHVDEVAVGADNPCTPAYAAPEVLGGEVRSVKQWQGVDRYSLATTAYLCLTGRFPFEGESALAVMYARAIYEAPAPSTFQPGLSRAVDAVLLRGLSRRVDERHDSAATFAEALRLALVGCC